MMCDLSYHTVSIHGASESEQTHHLANDPANAKASDSSFAPGEAAEQIDEGYLELRWSHTAKCLREFTQRKNAQAEQIRRQRASLQVQSVEEHSAALATAGQPSLPSPFAAVAQQPPLEPLRDTSSDQLPLPLQLPGSGLAAASLSSGSLRLRQSTRGHGSLLLPTSTSTSTSTSTGAILDALLQSVLQRSTAVSTKLTKAYAQPSDQDKEPASGDSRASVSGLRKAAAHVRGDRGRSMSRSHTRHSQMQHPQPPQAREGDASRPSPSSSHQQHQHQHQHQQRQPGRMPAPCASAVSPVTSRPGSPIEWASRDSTSSGMPTTLLQLPAAIPEPARPEAPLPAACEQKRPPTTTTTTTTTHRPRSRSRGEQRAPQQQPLPGSAGGEQQQRRRRQREPPPAAGARDAGGGMKRASSSGSGGSGGGGKPSSPLRRAATTTMGGSRRAHSRSLDGGGARVQRRLDGPYSTSGEGSSTAGALPRETGSRAARRRIGSGGSGGVGGGGGAVRFPQLSHATSRHGGGGGGNAGGGEGMPAGLSRGGGSGGAARGMSFGEGGKSMGLLTSGSGSAGEAVGRGGGLVSGRRAAAPLTMLGSRQGSLVRRSASGQLSYAPASPSGQSSWAMSTTSRELQFI